jgi:hypothetical protein
MVTDVTVDQKNLCASSSLKEIINELGDDTDIYTIPYKLVFTLRSNPRWPSKLASVWAEPKKSQ